MKKTRCPNCKSSAGMRAVGRDFVHRTVIHRESQAAFAPELFRLHYGRPNVKSVHDRDPGGNLPKILAWIEQKERATPEDNVILCEQGSGVICTRCGWSQRDAISINYDAFCQCGAALGTHSHHEKGFQPQHFCPDCSRKRVAEGTHDPEGAVTSFPLLCPGGCKRVVGHLSFPEGEKEELSHSQSKGHFCDNEDCSKVRRNLDELSRRAKELPLHSPPDPQA